MTERWCPPSPLQGGHNQPKGRHRCSPLVPAPSAERERTMSVAKGRFEAVAQTSVKTVLREVADPGSPARAPALCALGRDAIPPMVAVLRFAESAQCDCPVSSMFWNDIPTAERAERKDTMARWKPKAFRRSCTCSDHTAIGLGYVAQPASVRVALRFRAQAFNSRRRSVRPPIP